VSSEVLALSPTAKPDAINVDNHEVRQSPHSFEIASTPFSIKAFALFRERIKEVDLIHYHFPYPFADMLHFCVAAGKPSVLTYHSDIVKQQKLLAFYRPLKRKFLSSVDQVIATSQQYVDSSEALSRIKDNVQVIPIGLDKTTYPVAAKERLNFWKEKFGPRFFLFTGVLRYYKGLHSLIQAAKDSDYPIVIVGSGPIENKLKSQAEEEGVNNIHFIGFQPEEDKVALLTLCSAFVFPSHLRSEAFGISLLEAAMYGKALISCEIGTGTSFINVHQKTGFVVPPNAPKALREAMDKLWSDPTLAQSMGKQAQQRYSELFTAKQMAAAYAEVYKRVLDKRAMK
jgi:rhamnosyl/mannosyltransferase